MNKTLLLKLGVKKKVYLFLSEKGLKTYRSRIDNAVSDLQATAQLGLSPAIIFKFFYILFLGSFSHATSNQFLKNTISDVLTSKVRRLTFRKA